jgi:hypothetical protein
VQIDSEKGLPWWAPENIEANHGIADANVFLWMLKISQIPAKSGHFKQIKLHITQGDRLNGGGRGIRTPGTLAGTAVFKTACFNRSHIPPQRGEAEFHCMTTPEIAGGAVAPTPIPRSEK